MNKTKAVLIAAFLAASMLLMGKSKDEPKKPDAVPVISADLQKQAGDLEIESIRINEAAQSYQTAENDLRVKMSAICGDKFSLNYIPTPPRNVGKTWVCQLKPTPSPAPKAEEKKK